MIKTYLDYDEKGNYVLGRFENNIPTFETYLDYENGNYVLKEW